VAHASGYVDVRRVEDADQLRAAVQELLAPDPSEKNGPSFLLVKIEPDREERHIGRITHEPQHIVRRFMESINQGI
jgi:tetrahydromethanopterin S-methyltransferase subunit A